MSKRKDAEKPQQERAIATRKKLLDAAVQSLCARGYAGTTTTAIARDAGLSQGALFKQFGSKHRLIAATAAHLFDGLVGRFRAGVQASPHRESAPDALEATIRELWSVFLMPELYAVTELFIAARTDEPLRAELTPVVQEHRQNLLAEARMLFPEAAERNPQFEAAVDLALTAMQGAALHAAVLDDNAWNRDLAGLLEDIGRREFEAPYGASR